MVYCLSFVSHVVHKSHLLDTLHFVKALLKLVRMENLVITYVVII